MFKINEICDRLKINRDRGNVLSQMHSILWIINNYSILVTPR
jgi:hypothetical protein